MQTPLGDINVVSQDALVKALVDAAVVLDMSGGVLMVQLGRVPTGIENEMVTSGALVTWMDRGDARPQPEATVDIFPALDAAEEEDDGGAPDEPDEGELEPDELADGDDLLSRAEPDDDVVRHAEEAVVQDEPSDDPEFAVQGAWCPK